MNEGISTNVCHCAFVLINMLISLPLQNCLVRCDNGAFTAVVGDFGLAEKIPDYRSVEGKAGCWCLFFHCSEITSPSWSDVIRSLSSFMCKAD